MRRFASPATPGHPSRVARGWTDLAMLAAGVAVLVLAALPIEQYRVAAPEQTVFHLVNEHTVLPFVVVWTVMQLGNFLVVPTAAVAAAALRRWRLAAGFLAGGGAAYLLAKAIKQLVVRGRPSTLLTGVDIRGDAALGSGFVSGHAAVITLLAALAWPYLGPRARIVAVALAVVVCLSRVYVGAHLPLDIVGGAGLGLAVAGAVRLLLGRPADSAESARLRRGI